MDFDYSLWQQANGHNRESDMLISQAYVIREIGIAAPCDQDMDAPNCFLVHS